MAELLSSSTAAAAAAAATTRPQVAVERRSRPQKEQALNCPRCNSTNTKFCYYNNYSLTQPRYFCKACRRYWTEGGSLRNVPVGGGSRKNKRSSSSIATPLTTATAATSSQNPKFPNHSCLPDFVDFPRIESNSSCTTTTSAMDLLRAGISGRGVGPFMQMPMPIPAPQYRPGFGLQELRHPSLDFPLDRTGGYGGLQMQGVQESTNGRLLFPFEDLKVSPSIAEFEQNRGQGGGDPPGFWNGMIGGGGSW